MKWSRESGDCAIAVWTPAAVSAEEEVPIASAVVAVGTDKVRLLVEPTSAGASIELAVNCFPTIGSGSGAALNAAVTLARSRFVDRESVGAN